ncbi:growth-regulating factor 1 [Cajanus cajan]|uniref:growth-regulating factor 1 n=1 Tax=Cajanus cajan TaxID=3821 RepID=UPI00098DA330|nr:growth-regulating factor 1 [Cajanus cajan]
MRIRKNAKLSPLLFSSCVEGGSVPVETHVCQLNQSPWDVIPFDSDSIQFQLHPTFPAGNNGTAPHSFGPVESLASIMDTDNSHHAMTTIVPLNNNKVATMNIGATAPMPNPCQKFDNKGWPCKVEASQGQSFCNQHLSLSLSVPYNKKPQTQVQAQVQAQAQAQAQAQSSATGTRRSKSRAAGKKAAAGSSNPYEFYYYSGFGPLWGKRRGDRNGEGSKSGLNSTVESEDVAVDDINDNVAGVGGGTSVSEMDNEGIIDYVDDDEEEVDDSGKKRMRKPVKARSLKSLM